MAAEAVEGRVAAEGAGDGRALGGREGREYVVGSFGADAVLGEDVAEREGERAPEVVWTVRDGRVGRTEGSAGRAGRAMPRGDAIALESDASLAGCTPVAAPIEFCRCFGCFAGAFFATNGCCGWPSAGGAGEWAAGTGGGTAVDAAFEGLVEEDMAGEGAAVRPGDAAGVGCAETGVLAGVLRRNLPPTPISSRSITESSLSSLLELLDSPSSSSSCSSSSSSHASCDGRRGRAGNPLPFPSPFPGAVRALPMPFPPERRCCVAAAAAALTSALRPVAADIWPVRIWWMTAAR